MGKIIANSCMARDTEHEHVLKAGFFNSHGKITLDEFPKHFDVVKAVKWNSVRDLEDRPRGYLGPIITKRL